MFRLSYNILVARIKHLVETLHRIHILHLACLVAAEPSAQHGLLVEVGAGGHVAPQQPVEVELRLHLPPFILEEELAVNLLFVHLDRRADVMLHKLDVLMLDVREGRAGEVPQEVGRHHEDTADVLQGEGTRLDHLRRLWRERDVFPLESVRQERIAKLLRFLEVGQEGIHFVLRQLFVCLDDGLHTAHLLEETVPVILRADAASNRPRVVFDGVHALQAVLREEVEVHHVLVAIQPVVILRAAHLVPLPPVHLDQQHLLRVHRDKLLRLGALSAPDNGVTIPPAIHTGVDEVPKGERILEAVRAVLQEAEHRMAVRHGTPFARQVVDRLRQAGDGVAPEADGGIDGCKAHRRLHVPAYHQPASRKGRQSAAQGIEARAPMFPVEKATDCRQVFAYESHFLAKFSAKDEETFQGF